jgi:luciferase family oxidoreductase group 1
MRISLLDFQHPGAAVTLACAADEWGFRRYWLGEHHAPAQCANPLLLGALLAGVTSRIRIGSGGVSLTYSSPYRVAEDARLVEFMIPGRFDLGVTRGLMAPGSIAQALFDGRRASTDDYHARLELLHALVTGRSIGAVPSDWEPYLEAGPPMWVLGLSAQSAAVAGRLGTGFCFSLHHAAPGADARGIIDRYRAQFAPSAEFPEPVVIVVARFICGATGFEAQELAALASPSHPSLAPTIVGVAGDCVEQFCAIGRDLGAEEIMLLDFLQQRQDARLDMYGRIAEAAGLRSRARITRRFLDRLDGVIPHTVR